jgi:hypothetical protein
MHGQQASQGRFPSGHFFVGGHGEYGFGGSDGCFTGLFGGCGGAVGAAGTGVGSGSGGSDAFVKDNSVAFVGTFFDRMVVFKIDTVVIGNGVMNVVFAA